MTLSGFDAGRASGVCQDGAGQSFNGRNWSALHAPDTAARLETREHEESKRPGRPTLRLFLIYRRPNAKIKRGKRASAQTFPF